MALRTNRKEVKEAVKNYIMEHFTTYYYPDNKEYLPTIDTNNYNSVCKMILDIFHDEKVIHDNRYKANRINKQELFTEWTSGLCSALDTDYYYNVSAVDIVANWLQETQTEKEKYTEAQAEKLIDYLLYRELTNNAK